MVRSAWEDDLSNLVFVSPDVVVFIAVLFAMVIPRHVTPESIICII